jgi:hypothetical protein
MNGSSRLSSCFRIEELLRIKGSVQTELQNLERKRQVMLQDLAQLTRKIGRGTTLTGSN